MFGKFSLAPDWYKSKTFWFAVLGIVAGVLGWNDGRVQAGQALIVTVLSLLGFGIRDTLAKGQVAKAWHSTDAIYGLEQIEAAIKSLHSKVELAASAAGPFKVVFTGPTVGDGTVSVGSGDDLGNSSTKGGTSGSVINSVADGTHDCQACDCEGDSDECNCEGDEDDCGCFDDEDDCVELLIACMELLVTGKQLIRQFADGKASYADCYGYIQSVDHCLVECDQSEWVKLDEGELSTAEDIAADLDRVNRGYRSGQVPTPAPEVTPAVDTAGTAPQTTTTDVDVDGQVN